MNGYYRSGNNPRDKQRDVQVEQIHGDQAQQIGNDLLGNRFQRKLRNTGRHKQVDGDGRRDHADGDTHHEHDIALC